VARRLQIGGRTISALRSKDLVSPRRRGVLWRRSRGAVAIVAAAQRHALDALADLSHLDVPQLLLEELEVSTAIAHLGVESGADGLVVGLRTHSIGSVDQSLLPLNLLGDILDCLILIHGAGGGSAMRTRKTVFGGDEEEEEQDGERRGEEHGWGIEKKTSGSTKDGTTRVARGEGVKKLLGMPERQKAERVSGGGKRGME
jgi:hypothetical protein